MHLKEKNKERNPASFPYEKLLQELISEQPQIKFSEVLQYALSCYKEKSLLKLMAKFSDSLKHQFPNELLSRNFKGSAEIAKKLNWEIIGQPLSNNQDSERSSVPFFGCQVISKEGKKIYLSSDLTVSRARATIAHEIMHSLFATINMKRPGSLPSDYVEEILCDYEAARLLIDDFSLNNELNSSNNINIAEG